MPLGDLQEAVPMQIPTLPPKTILLIHLALFFLSLYASPLCDPSPPSD